MSQVFKRISVMGRYQDPTVFEALSGVVQHLLARGCEVQLDELIPHKPIGCKGVAESQLVQRCDLLISIGGDGTLLRAAGLVQHQAVPILGINRGRLGFLADISPEEMVERIDAVLSGDFETDERKRLDAAFVDDNGAAQQCRVLNEITIQKHETGRMLDFETCINGRYVNSHGGDGLVIATATGSTGYALSCGGPILTPQLDAIVLAPIAPHTLSDRPIVVSGQSTIEVRLNAQAPMTAAVTGDGSVRGMISKDTIITIRPSVHSITLIHPHGHDHFGILRSKLHWGRGNRSPGAPHA